MTDTVDFGYGDELVGFLIDSSAVDDQVLGEAAYGLLRQVFLGYPLDRIVPLLRSEHERVARSGAWILSELAVQAAPLMS